MAITELWTPPQAKTLPRAAVPVGAVWLKDNTRLRVLDHVTLDVGGGTMQRQTRFTGPKHLRVVASVDPTPHGGLLHVSLSYPNRLPPWAMVRMVRDAFFPDSVDVMMVLPRAQDYVNLHEFTFHLWQTPTGWGLM